MPSVSSEITNIQTPGRNESAMHSKRMSVPVSKNDGCKSFNNKILVGTCIV